MIDSPCWKALIAVCCSGTILHDSDRILSSHRVEALLVLSSTRISVEAVTSSSAMDGRFTGVALLVLRFFLYSLPLAALLGLILTMSQGEVFLRATTGTGLSSVSGSRSQVGLSKSLDWGVGVMVAGEVPKMGDPWLWSCWQ